MNTASCSRGQQAPSRKGERRGGPSDGSRQPSWAARKAHLEQDSETGLPGELPCTGADPGQRQAPGGPAFRIALRPPGDKAPPSPEETHSRLLTSSNLNANGTQGTLASPAQPLNRDRALNSRGCTGRPGGVPLPQSRTRPGEEGTSYSFPSRRGAEARVPGPSTHRPASRGPGRPLQSPAGQGCQVARGREELRTEAGTLSELPFCSALGHRAPRHVSGVAAAAWSG